MSFFILSVLVIFTVGAIGYLLGDAAGWNRRGRYEPQKSIELMEAENKEIQWLAEESRRRFDYMLINLDISMHEVAASMHHSHADKKALRNQIYLKFANAMDRDLHYFTDGVRRGPWTMERARNFLGAVLDAVYTHNKPIAEAVEEIADRLYIEPRPKPEKVPVTPAEE